MQGTHAQLTKGNWLVGGSGYLSSQTQSQSGLNVKGFNLELSPGVGYFFVDKLVGGVKIGFTYSKIKYLGVAQNSTNIRVGPFLRYYLLNSEKRINIFSEASYQYSHISGNSFNSYNENTLRFSAGPVIYFNSSVGLEISLNYEYYNSPKTETDVNKVFLGIGFQIHLESNKN